MYVLNNRDYDFSHNPAALEFNYIHLLKWM